MFAARREDLLIEDLGDECVVYDPVRHQGHCLNRTAQLVLQASDGATSVAAIAARLQADLKTAIDEDVVWSALEQLAKSHLLQKRPARKAVAGRFPRRELARRLVATGVAAVVVSMGAPKANAALATFCNSIPINSCCPKSCQGMRCAKNTRTCDTNPCTTGQFGCTVAMNCPHC